jgi:hypothetical protein
MNSTQPILGSLAIDDKDEPSQSHDYGMALFVSLSQEEYTDFTEARSALLTLQHNSQLYRIVLWNHRDYYSTLDNYLTAYVEKDTDYLSQFPSRLGINRCLLNLLSSVRTYLDYTEMNLSRKYGDASQSFLNFKRYCSDAFDGHFSYRFLSKLRNYSQHCGLPIDNIVFSTSFNPANPGKPFCSLEVGIKRDPLLEGFNWKKLKKELREQPPIIDINHHVDVMVELIGDINSKVIADEFPLLRVKASLIWNFAERVFSHPKYTAGAPYIFEVLSDNGKLLLDRNMNFVPIPVDIAQAVLDENAEHVV